MRKGGRRERGRREGRSEGWKRKGRGWWREKRRWEARYSIGVCVCLVSESVRV